MADRIEFGHYRNHVYDTFVPRVAAALSTGEASLKGLDGTLDPDLRQKMQRSVVPDFVLASELLERAVEKGVVPEGALSVDVRVDAAAKELWYVLVKNV